VGKKARALEAIVRELGLKTPVHHCRAEDVFARHAFDALTVRAVAPLTAAHVVRRTGTPLSDC
jgi:16S rRNA G527 N7-methylase RsmG